MPEWKDTVNLPRTDFPMKANLPTSEPETLARWTAMDLYGKIRERRAGAPSSCCTTARRTPTATSTWARR
jgi:isoleucyl-tRNA synthetase